jgi:hypothetical protein
MINDYFPKCRYFSPQAVNMDFVWRYGPGTPAESGPEQLRRIMISEVARGLRLRRRKMSGARSVKDVELRELGDALQQYVLEIRQK